ncbi:MAG: DNA polymerase III subunit delta', partial [Gemmatimonadaceae bacterium]|nr:DNA polymerase III subunit delta' [Gloeobacterales cyanobacterium ES-bin-141]
MAQGSPGEALELIEWFDAMPADLLDALDGWSAQASSLRTALELARRIDHDLASEQQNRLVDYLQHAAWQHRRTDLVQALEALRRHLQTYISPRLAWEVALGGLKASF